MKIKLRLVTHPSLLPDPIRVCIYGLCKSSYPLYLSGTTHRCIPLLLVHYQFFILLSCTSATQQRSCSSSPRLLRKLPTQYRMNGPPVTESLPSCFLMLMPRPILVYCALW